MGDDTSHEGPRARGNGDGTHRAAGHATAPCKLYDPRFDFNDAVIPLDSTMWMRLAEGWLNVASPATRNRASG
jgi:hypothetical protein